ncbi:MAG TPA: tRNA1(Val) (adenine(37)-N6)-methyltransferase [Clostridiales bacterium]|nr:tRNA1(Val) (adenine(37)-N6)-methyltransferase [Clostridiales bacterium]
MKNKGQNIVKIHPNERIDDLHRNGYKIIQNPKKFCFGMDAVLLSGFVKVLPGEQVVDLGTGTGIIPILLEAKSKGDLFTGLEIQKESADMAKRSVILNNIEKRVKIIIGDIKNSSNIFKKNSIDVITCNPPYMTANHGLTNSDESKAVARHEILCTLKEIIRETSLILKPGGRFYMVHRPFRLVEILNTLSEYKLEPKRMRMVHPFIDKEPNMVLIECVKGGKSMLKVEAPLIVYKEVNVYTDEIYDIYGY